MHELIEHPSTYMEKYGMEKDNIKGLGEKNIID